MNILKSLNNKINGFLIGTVYAAADFSNNSEVNLTWKVPSLADIISFLIKFLFVMVFFLAPSHGLPHQAIKRMSKKHRTKFKQRLLDLLLLLQFLPLS
jgi:hypothetical protein